MRRLLSSRALMLTLVAAGIALALAFRGRLDPAALEQWIGDLGLLAPVAYVLLYSLATVLFLPGTLFALAGGALFGPLWGSLLNLLGATTGAGLAFLIARHIAGERVASRAGGRLKQLIEGVEAEGWRFVALVRLVPLFPFNLTNYALGLTRIPFTTYVLTSLIAMAPGAIAYTWLGHAGREALAGNASAIRHGLIALGLLAAVAFLPRLVTRLRGRSGFQWINPDRLRHLLDAGTATVIDVREPEEFSGPLGHIQGALNIPLQQLDARLTEINACRERPVILVCRTHRRSAAAAASLHSEGFGDLYVLRGGMEAWHRDKAVDGHNAALA